MATDPLPQYAADVFIAWNQKAWVYLVLQLLPKRALTTLAITNPSLFRVSTVKILALVLQNSLIWTKILPYTKAMIS